MVNTEVTPDFSGTIKHQRYWIIQQILTHVQTPRTSLAGGGHLMDPQSLPLSGLGAHTSVLFISHTVSSIPQLMYLEAFMEGLVKLFLVDFLSTFPGLFPHFL